MIKDIIENKSDYSVLALISGIFIAYFVRFNDRPDLLFKAVVIFASTYVVWGLIHHLRVKALTIKIMLEYVLVALLATVVASTLLL